MSHKVVYIRIVLNKIFLFKALLLSCVMDKCIVPNVPYLKYLIDACDKKNFSAIIANSTPHETRALLELIGNFINCGTPLHTSFLEKLKKKEKVFQTLWKVRSIPVSAKTQMLARNAKVIKVLLTALEYFINSVKNV